MRGTSATLHMWFTLTITLLTANLFQGDPCDGKAVGDVKVLCTVCTGIDYVSLCGTLFLVFVFQTLAYYVARVKNQDENATTYNISSQQSPHPYPCLMQV